MSDELFAPETVQMDSPRLAWLKRHGVITFLSAIEPKCWYAGLPAAPVDAFMWFGVELAEYGDSRCGVGDTEDDAITDLAIKRGLKLWNQEGA